jgi:hypothetical protein
VETDIESGILTVELTPYKVVIDEDFFIAIEWIEDLGPRKLFSLEAFSVPH